jgi:hypothetical protein
MQPGVEPSGIDGETNSFNPFSFLVQTLTYISLVFILLFILWVVYPSFAEEQRNLRIPVISNYIFLKLFLKPIRLTS